VVQIIIMKKTFFTFLAFVFVNAALGQPTVALKSGINIATTKDLIAFPKNRLGWYAGISSYLPLGTKIFIQPELLFSSKGYSYVDFYDDNRAAMRLNYLSLPFMLGYKIDRRTEILGGTEVGYLLQASNMVNGRNDDATSSFPKRFVIGLAIGLKYHLLKKLGIEARYVYGLGTFYQTDVVGVRRSKFWAANRAFQLGFDYKLH
jgi:hypothetical protein